jgi:hypothetical protein
MFHQLALGQVMNILNQAAPEVRTPQAVAGLTAASKLIPPGEATAILTLRNHYKIYANETVVDLSEEYFFPNNKQLIFETMFRYKGQSLTPEVLSARLRVA